MIEIIEERLEELRVAGIRPSAILLSVELFEAIGRNYIRLFPCHPAPVLHAAEFAIVLSAKFQ